MPCFTRFVFIIYRLVALWKTMQREQKEIYFNEARKAIVDHKLKYPGKDTTIMENRRTVLCTYIPQYLTQLCQFSESPTTCPALRDLLFIICRLGAKTTKKYTSKMQENGMQNIN
jgi:hypothetical protein